MNLVADVFPKLGTRKNMVSLLLEKSRFRASVEKQHSKCAQTLFKCEEQLPYHFY